MKERLLQYIWQFQYFNKSSLTTISGEPLQVINSGSFNTNQGPDFLEAKIKIDNTIWAGNIELQKKSAVIFNYLNENNFHWEEMFWWMLAKNFGTKINGEAFEKIARSLPVNILAKHKNQIHQLEALLFGQAGLLDKDFVNDYPLM